MDCSSAKTLIVLEGPVGAGKSTTLHRLRELFQYESGIGFIEEPTFTECKLLHRTYNPLHVIYDQCTQENYVCSQLHITRALADFYENEVLDKEILVMDRWIWSCRHFIMLRKRALSNFSLDYLLTNVKERHNLFLERLGPRVSIRRFYLNTPADQCYANISKRNRPEETVCPQSFWMDFNQRFSNEVLRSDGTYEVFETGDAICREISRLVAYINPQPRAPADIQRGDTEDSR